MSKEKLIIILLLILSAFVVYYSNSRNGNGVAGIWSGEETEFSRPVDIIWSGEIISTMANGSCIGLKGEFNNYQWAIACLPDTDSNGLWKFEGAVTVTGKWLGISCAYKNTIFGECVPDVSIENIGQ